MLDVHVDVILFVNKKESQRYDKKKYESKQCTKGFKVYV
jgi:hypothetical protein